MIYITQLIFIQPGKEATFLEFESFAIPLLEAHNGKMLYRIRPEKKAFVTANGEEPYEIHFISFPSDSDLNSFLKDDRRMKYLHLKEASIRSNIIVKGKEM